MGTTSGSINVITVQRDEFIKDALQDLRVLGDGASPSANDLTDCTRKFNFILKKLPTEGILLWTRDTIPIPLQANKTQYTIGPSGADVTSYRPLRAFEGCFVRNVTGGQTSDTQLRMLSRLEYQQISNKLVPGIINSWYYDPQMTKTPNVAYDPSQSFGIVNFYVTPVDATRTAYMEVQRPLQEIVNSTDCVDCPEEWYEGIAKMLGAAVADKYEIPEQRITRIKAEAKQAWKEILDWGATEQAPIYFTPDPVMYIQGAK